MANRRRTTAKALGKALFVAVDDDTVPYELTKDLPEGFPYKFCWNDVQINKRVVLLEVVMQGSKDLMANRRRTTAKALGKALLVAADDDTVPSELPKDLPESFPYKFFWNDVQKKKRVVFLEVVMQGSKDWRTMVTPVELRYKDDGDVPGKHYPHIRSPKDEDSTISAKDEYLLMKKQVQDSKGFDIDFTKFRCIFNYKPVNLDVNIKLPLKLVPTRDIMDSLSRESLERFNEINSTKYELVKVIKANFHVSHGIMFYITFQGKLLNGYDSKVFQAKVSYGGIPEFISC